MQCFHNYAFLMLTKFYNVRLACSVQRAKETYRIHQAERKSTNNVEECHSYRIRRKQHRHYNNMGSKILC